ncbi:MAG: GtrA family protein [Mediterranea sp.]|jgi:putative flippase GtrA|nr:GtrA family protein [Mediterranea sp.]
MWRQIKYFIKAQFSAGVGYLCDYTTMLIFKEVLGVYYLIAIAMGGLIGAIVNFTISHFWAFRPEGQHYSRTAFGQMWRYACVLVTGLTIKIVGTNLLTIYTGVDYKLTRLVMDAIVAICFNYTLQRYYVFKPRKASEPVETTCLNADVSTES